MPAVPGSATLDSHSVGEGTQELDRNRENLTRETFDQMGLHESLLKGIYDYGFEHPSPIQQKGIVAFAMGYDVIGKAHSGTGKTATFCTGILQRLDLSNCTCQALLLAPTRELAYQIRLVMTKLGKDLGVQCALCVGGRPIREDQKTLRAGVHVIVGCPGRVLDLLDRQPEMCENICMFVLDEADKMLDRNFKNTIYDIYQLLPPIARDSRKLQVGLFSATLTQEALDITRKFMNNPVKIEVGGETTTLDGISQYYVYVDKEECKLETLCNLYETLTINQSIVFVNTIDKVVRLQQAMIRQDHTVSAIHGDLSSDERTRIMKEFQDGSTRVLIATDIIGRGIDVQQVSVVINFDLPVELENYLHRIGRSGRFGRKGRAINFVRKKDEQKFSDIQDFYRITIPELPHARMS